MGDDVSCHGMRRKLDVPFGSRRPVLQPMPHTCQICSAYRAKNQTLVAS